MAPITKFKAGDIAPVTTLESVSSEPIKLADSNHLVHLQFRRFVDCPICNTHISELRRRAREIDAAGTAHSTGYPVYSPATGMSR